MSEIIRLTNGEIKQKLQGFLEQLNLLAKKLEIENKKKEILDIKNQEEASDFWLDNRKAKEILQKKSTLQSDIDAWGLVKQKIDDAFALFELAQEADDEDSFVELSNHVPNLEKDVSELEFRTMLSGEADKNNAIVTLNAGSGGTESQDWAEMLLRMYQKWATSKGYKTEIVDYLAGEGAGIKSATMTVEGEFAYGWLKAEVGVHRLVRISPFDSNARRHTSFSSVFVLPEIDDSIEIDLKDADIRVDTYRAGGCGGQGVNTTDSAVRLTHMPTGIVVQCQNERSQIKNKALAMKILRARIYEKHLEEQRKKFQEVEDNKSDNSWGNQIRSYVLHPYKMVKDHRTGEESSQAEKTLDGDIDEFLRAFLLGKKASKK